MMAPVKVARLTIELGLEAILCVPQHIGQDEPALGIRVEHLDRLARHRPVTISPGRWAVPGHHVLDEADEADGIDRRLVARRAHA